MRDVTSVTFSLQQQRPLPFSLRLNEELGPQPFCANIVSVLVEKFL